MFITFEGIDGSGKSTQIRLLKKRLHELNQAVEVYREPGGTHLSEEIREILLNSSHNIDPVTEVLLFSSARSQLVAEKVIPKLEQDEVVILDRFYDSTTAYQGYGRKSLSIEQIRMLNKIAGHGIVPDLTFYLRIELDESKKRTEQFEKDRMEQSGDEFFEKVIQGFDELARQEKRFITLDSTKPREKVQEEIWNHVSGYLK